MVLPPGWHSGTGHPSSGGGRTPIPLLAPPPWVHPAGGAAMLRRLSITGRSAHLAAPTLPLRLADIRASRARVASRGAYGSAAGLLIGTVLATIASDVGSVAARPAVVASDAPGFAGAARDAPRTVAGHHRGPPARGRARARGVAARGAAGHGTIQRRRRRVGDAPAPRGGRQGQRRRVRAVRRERAASRRDPRLRRADRGPPGVRHVRIDGAGLPAGRDGGRPAGGSGRARAGRCDRVPRRRRAPRHAPHRGHPGGGRRAHVRHPWRRGALRRTRRR